MIPSMSSNGTASFLLLFLRLRKVSGTWLRLIDAAEEKALILKGNMGIDCRQPPL